jgi:hypothetical protein
MLVNLPPHDKTIVIGRGHQYDDYTPVEMNGVEVPPSGWTAPSPVFYQGEDMQFDAAIFYEGTPVTSLNWTVTAVVKRDRWLVETAWTGVSGSGITEGGSGLWEINIPASSFISGFNGTYWMNIIGTSGIITRVLAVVPFVFEYSASSPHPESLQNSSGVINAGLLAQSFPIPGQVSVAIYPPNF